MSVADFSLRLQHGITGGFIPPQPSAIFTVTSAPGTPFLQITSAVRPEGAHALEDQPAKEVSKDDTTQKLVTELHRILKSLPTESPPGSEDIYGLDIGLAFGSEDLQWANGGPQGCSRGVSDVQATDEDKVQFRRAVEIVRLLAGQDPEF